MGLDLVREDKREIDHERREYKSLLQAEMGEALYLKPYIWIMLESEETSGFGGSVCEGCDE